MLIGFLYELWRFIGSFADTSADYTDHKKASYTDHKKASYTEASYTEASYTEAAEESLEWP